MKNRFVKSRPTSRWFSFNIYFTTPWKHSRMNVQIFIKIGSVLDHVFQNLWFFISGKYVSFVYLIFKFLWVWFDRIWSDIQNHLIIYLWKSFKNIWKHIMKSKNQLKTIKTDQNIWLKQKIWYKIIYTLNSIKYPNLSKLR